jgi:hypothetical protein
VPVQTETTTSRTQNIEKAQEHSIDYLSTSGHLAMRLCAIVRRTRGLLLRIVYSGGTHGLICAIFMKSS